VAIVLGITARLFFAVAPGNRVSAPWSGVSDAPAYSLLAHNVTEGMGLSYCGMPDAIRPPLYPLLLAGLIKIFGPNFAAATRILQFLGGLLMAYLCYSIAKRLWGHDRALLAGAVSLLMPTLAYLSGEIMTESFAALIVTAFLGVLLKQLESPRWSGWALSGLLVGLGTLIRFNLAVLGIVAVGAVWTKQGAREGYRAAALVTISAAMMVAPWIVRNLRQFHGRVLLSSQTGYNMVEGLVTPEGRALPGDSGRLVQAEGWAQAQIETNDSSRLSFPDEGKLNSDTTQIAVGLWRKAGLDAVPILLKKIGYFWLETDQLTWYPGRGAMVRKLGVLIWWLILVVAVAGWFQLRQGNASAASVLLLYAGVVTVFHTPFVMNTRLGAPFLAPLASVLAPGYLGLRKAVSSLAPLERRLRMPEGDAVRSL
jgi:4-amino-4-deoxy-L-arabinose transferase-like glycosyltransferase